MSQDGWLERQVSKWETDPAFILEGVLLDVNERICALMDAKGISRSELARRLGKSRQYVTRLLNGQPNVTLRTLTEIAVALGEGLEVAIPSSATEARQHAVEARQTREVRRWVVVEQARWRGGRVLRDLLKEQETIPRSHEDRYALAVAS